MYNKTAKSTWAKHVATALTLVLLSGISQAQVNVINKPFRSPAPTAQAPDLDIAPYSPPSVASTIAPSPAQTAVSVPPPQRWAILLEDQTLSRALGRWARQEGLQFFWEAPKDLAAVRASYLGSFDKALREVMVDSPSSGYPLHACRHDNAVRVLHTSQPCNH